MDDLISTLPWLAASIVVLAVIVFGLGFALQFQSRVPRFALPVIGAILAFVPPVGIVLTGRNLSLKNINFLESVDPGGLAAWILRVSSAVLVALAIAAILVNVMDRTQRPTAGRPLLFAFVAYFTTNIVLNSAFGTVPDFVASNLYALLLVLAVFLLREQGYAGFVNAVKWGLFLTMVGSFAFIPVDPALVMQTNTLEVRLPFVNFRFWGIGSGPNSIGPLAVVQLLLTIHLPFRSRFLQFLSLLSAGGVLLLAQSQTSWLSAALIFPPYLIYRWLTDEVKGAQRRLSPLLVAATVLLGGAMTLAAASFFVNWVEVFDTLAGFLGIGPVSTDRIMSGRGQIWAVAFTTFLENPLFGYGITAWDSAFRAKINLPYAFHAHNQLVQALSVGGLLGAAGFLLYVFTLAYYSLKLARFTRGLAPALLTLMLVRSITEVPFSLGTVLIGEFLTQLTLFALLAGSIGLASARAAKPAAAAPARSAVLQTPMAQPAATGGLQGATATAEPREAAAELPLPAVFRTRRSGSQPGPDQRIEPRIGNEQQAGD